MREPRRLPIVVAALALALGACGSPSSPSGGAPAPTAHTTTPPAVPSSPSAPAATPSPGTPPPGPTSAAPTGDAEYHSAITPVSATDLGASWHAGCPLTVDQLRSVEVAFWGYDGVVHTGRLIVAEDVAQDVADIMGDLFRARFPIERMTPVSEFGGDDDASMAANNTSAFNCRAITGGTTWSEHAYGAAIDVNPLVNPYVLGDVVLPPEGAAYVDRSQEVPGMVHAGDDVVRAFAARGWSWGGSWTAPVDYQHFSASGG